MKAREKKLEIILKFVPTLLILISITYITQFCSCNLKQKSANQYSDMLDQNIRLKTNQNQFYHNDVQDKNQNIIVSDNKSITIRKINQKDFSMVLF